MEVSAVLVVVTGQYQIRAPVTKGPKPASKPGKPPPNIHLAVNTRRIYPSQATDKPYQGELHHQKTITPVFGPPLSTWAKQKKRNPVKAALASPQNKTKK